MLRFAHNTKGEPMSVRENLKRLRQARGWSQSETARAVGVSARSYENWESGRREPRLDAVRRLAVAFGVSLDVLLVAAEGGAM